MVPSRRSRRNIASQLEYAGGSSAIRSPAASALSTDALTELSTYWKGVREFYLPFESEALAAGGDLYQHEMPVGQYTNLYQQARALGLAGPMG